MDTLNLLPKTYLFDHGGGTAHILPISSFQFWLIILAFIFLTAFFLLLIREIRCWYWKINLRTELLVVIGEELEEIKEILKNKDKVDNDKKVEGGDSDQFKKASIN